jgi:hypothetical protein
MTASLLLFLVVAHRVPAQENQLSLGPVKGMQI